MAFDDYFSILEVHLNASEEVIKAAYKKLVQRYHPDNDGNHKMMRLVNDAYETLTNGDKKRAYIESYMKHYGLEVPSTNREWEKSMYDFSLLPLRHLILEYLFFIKNGAYDDAYDMLSHYNKKQLFRKEFVEWQKLVATFHQLKEFDCTYYGSGTIEYSDSKYLKRKPYVLFKVRVIESNMMLDTMEEDYFNRTLVYDEEGWRILLKQDRLKPTIKKYKRLRDVYKKNADPRRFNKKNSDDRYATGYVTRQTFLENCEHEQIRYMRYNNNFSMIGLKVGDVDLISYIRKILENSTRLLDCMTYIERGYFLVLLPETNEEEGKLVCHKLMKLCRSELGIESIVAGHSVLQHYDSVKELLGEVTNEEFQRN